MLLQDEPHRLVERIRETVRRPVRPSTARVHALLRYLADSGFGYAPRVIGFDDQGREMLTYLHGESGPAGWAKVVTVAGLVAMGRLLRAYHEVVAGYRPAGIAADEVMCHGDFGPWTLVWDGVRPVGILDWDEARPARPVFDLAYALEYVVPFRDDDTCRRWLAYPTPPDRRWRLETFARAYGTDAGLADLVDEVIAQQYATRARSPNSPPPVINRRPPG